MFHELYKNEIVANIAHEYVFILVLLCSSRCAFAHLIKTLKYYKRIETVDQKVDQNRKKDLKALKKKSRRSL